MKRLQLDQLHSEVRAFILQAVQDGGAVVVDSAGRSVCAVVAAPKVVDIPMSTEERMRRIEEGVLNRIRAAYRNAEELQRRPEDIE